MQQVKQNSEQVSQERLEYKSLDSLIEWINDALQPGKEDKLRRVMSDLAEDRKRQNSSEQQTDAV